MSAAYYSNPPTADWYAASSYQAQAQPPLAASNPFLTAQEYNSSSRPNSAPPLSPPRFNQSKQQRSDPPPYPSSSAASSYDSSRGTLTYANSSRVISNTAAADKLPENASIYEQQKALYENPFASNPDWAPSATDVRLTNLPQIDLMLRVKARFRTGNPMDPPPRSFARPAPAVRPSTFAPMVLPSNGKHGLIGQGFTPAYQGQVFAPRDVSAADYSRFIEDIVVSGKVNRAAQIVANVAPISMHMGITGYFVTKAVVRAMARRNEPKVIDNVEAWAGQFFVPRSIDVFVVLDGERVTGRAPGQMPPDLSPQEANYLRQFDMGRSYNKRPRGSDKKKKQKKHEVDGPYLVFAPMVI